MEYVIGPLVGVLISLGYIKGSNAKHVIKMHEYNIELHDALEKIDEVESRLDLLSKKVETVDEEVLAKSLKIITPLAQATQRLQDTIGVK